VWRALVEIPRGEVRSYAEVAEQAGHPKACRATGSAVGANPVSVLVPCHRVVRRDGATGQYRWGSARKKVLINWERK
jgi:AraC family transcriptional regulator of adaptative response/methylated-DNA-[protein]-cysteine methyltransferase